MRLGQNLSRLLSLILQTALREKLAILDDSLLLGASLILWLQQFSCLFAGQAMSVRVKIAAIEVQESIKETSQAERSRSHPQGAVWNKLMLWDEINQAACRRCCASTASPQTDAEV